MGEEKTLGRLKERYYWPGHYADVRNWCATCVNCAARKSPAPKNKSPLTSVKVGEPLQLVAVDIMDRTIQSCAEIFRCHLPHTRCPITTPPPHSPL